MLTNANYKQKNLNIIILMNITLSVICMDLISGKSLTMKNIEIMFHGSVSILLSILKLLTIFDKQISNNLKQTSNIFKIWSFVEDYIAKDIRKSFSLEYYLSENVSIDDKLTKSLDNILCQYYKLLANESIKQIFPCHSESGTNIYSSDFVEDSKPSYYTYDAKFTNHFSVTDTSHCQNFYTR